MSLGSLLPSWPPLSLYLNWLLLLLLLCLLLLRMQLLGAIDVCRMRLCCLPDAHPYPTLGHKVRSPCPGPPALAWHKALHWHPTPSPVCAAHHKTTGCCRCSCLRLRLGLCCCYMLCLGCCYMLCLGGLLVRKLGRTLLLLLRCLRRVVCMGLGLCLLVRGKVGSNLLDLLVPVGTVQQGTAEKEATVLRQISTARQSKHSSTWCQAPGMERPATPRNWSWP